jgi:hypothetical protein
MDEERFNLEIRRFLKRFGVTSQREIERAVAQAIERGTLRGEEVLDVQATLQIPGVLDDVRIAGRIALAGPPTPDEP